MAKPTRAKGDPEKEPAAPPRHDPGEREYLTPGEVARMLHVSPKTVNRWATDKRIPCIVTLGGHRRFLREDVLAVSARMRGETEPGSTS